MSEPTMWSDLAARLPSLIDSQFAEYRRLVAITTDPDDGPREVVAWENARKAALAHLQSLLRILDLVQAQAADRGEGADDTDAAIADLLAEVRKELASDADDAGDARESGS